APTGGSIAFVAQEGSKQGEILIADGTAGILRLVATFTGGDLQRDIAVRVVGWSSDGGTLLVTGGHLSPASAERDCGNLFLVATGGSSVVKVTHNGPGA